jgi:hypothetical protein
LEPTHPVGYIRSRPLYPDFEGDTHNIGDLTVDRVDVGDGVFRIDDNGLVVRGATANTFSINNADGGAILGSWGVIQTSPGALAPHEEAMEKAIYKFLKEKVTLNVSLSQLSAGLELKVSLNLTDTNEEILSGEDFARN